STGFCDLFFKGTFRASLLITSTSSEPFFSVGKFHLTMLDTQVQSNSVRQRKKRGITPNPAPGSGSEDEVVLSKAIKANQAKDNGSSVGHKIALTVVTILAFITRFYKINYPDQVVFDEVHFGKVSLHDFP